MFAFLSWPCWFCLRAGVEVWSKECTSYHTPDAGHPAALIPHARGLHMLHFLVDGVDSSLWSNGISVDAAKPPAGVRIALLSLSLTWPALKQLFKRQHHPQQRQQPLCLADRGPDSVYVRGGADDEDGAFDVGGAMMAILSHM